jgi:uncharacterized protein YdeI (YjbR/CyaY-like superfamily)
MTATKFFKTQKDFHKWLEKNHSKFQELIVGFYKVNSGKPSIRYQEALDEALCFGWIDGIRRNIDEISYSIRFTPRRPKSYWSAVNTKRVAELAKLGLMQPSGLKTFNGRDKKKTERYSNERKNVKLDPEYEKRFKMNKKAWEFFQSKPPSYQKPAVWWIMSAKQEETRLKRLTQLIEDSENGRSIAPLTRTLKAK